MRDDEAALAAGGQGEGFTEAERLVLQEKLLAFLARQTALYTAGESRFVLPSAYRPRPIPLFCVGCWGAI